MGRPSRLPGFDYAGPHAYFFTVCAFRRHRRFADYDCAAMTRDQLLRTAEGYGFDVIAYCLMPDHLHALVEGTRTDSDFKRFVSMFKQRTGYSYRQTAAERLWQESFQEHVLRNDEAIESVAAYIVGNPIRAALCDELHEYPFLGSCRYSLDELREAIQLSPLSKASRP
jgi:putative transposase